MVAGWRIAIWNPRQAVLISGERHEELLQLVGLDIVGIIGIGQALLKSVGDDEEAGAVQGFRDCRKLLHDGAAVSVLFRCFCDRGELAEDRDAAEEIRNHLLRVGIDQVTRYVTSVDGLPSFVPRIVIPADLEQFDAAMVLDVRSKTEHAAGHIPGSQQLSAGRVLWHQDELSRSESVVTYCQTGVRNSVAANALRRAGHDVVELDGSFGGWSDWKNS